MDGHSYLDMLNKEILSTLATLLFLDHCNHGYLQRFWWIQDVVPGHCLGKVNHGLEKVFWSRVAAVSHKNKWPSKSPSLTPHNFLWGLMRSHKDSKTPLQKLQELHDRTFIACIGLSTPIQKHPPLPCPAPPIFFFFKSANFPSPPF